MGRMKKMPKIKEEEDAMARDKYIVRNKRTDQIICGIRWDSEKEEMLVGGPKGMIAETDNIMGIFDMVAYEADLSEEIIIDGNRIRSSYRIGEQLWNDFFRRLNQFYKVDKVKSFRRLMN